MSKKHKDDEEQVVSDEVTSEQSPRFGDFTVTSDELPVVEEPKKYFESVTWNKVKQVYRCCTCGTNRDDRDSMILHVLNHVPEKDREAVMNNLLKEN